MLVEVVEDDAGVLVAFELDDHPDAVAVRLVADVGDALDLLTPYELGDLLDQLGLVDLVRELPTLVYSLSTNPNLKLSAGT